MTETRSPGISFDPVPKPTPPVATEPIAPTEEEEPLRAPNVVELAAAYALALEYVEADVGQMTDEKFSELADNENALHDKLANYGAGVKINDREAEYYNSRAAILQAVVDELKHNAKMLENLGERKKARLHQVMTFFRIRNVKNSHATVFMKKNPPTVDVINERLALEALPEVYIRTTRAIDKKPLLDAIKADPKNSRWEARGVALKPDSSSLQIR